MLDVRVPSSMQLLPRRFGPDLPITLLILFASLVPAATQAGPVVTPGSSYTVVLNQAAAPAGEASYFNSFDVAAEAFTHRAGG